jgi:hypothetical protein
VPDKGATAAHRADLTGNKLQGKIHDDHRTWRKSRDPKDLAGQTEWVWSTGCCGCEHVGAFDHRCTVVDADNLGNPVHGNVLRHGKATRAERAAQIIAGGVRQHMALGQHADHVHHQTITRYGAANHVGKHPCHRVVKLKVANCRLRLLVDGIFAHVRAVHTRPNIEV